MVSVSFSTSTGSDAFFSRNVSGPATYADAAAGRLIAGEDVFERDVAVLANRRRAAHRVRRRPGAALVAREHVGDREVGEERREGDVLDDL